MQYISGGPLDTVEPEFIRMIPDTLRAGCTIFCTCGRYMVFRQPSELRRISDRLNEVSPGNAKP